MLCEGQVLAISVRAVRAVCRLTQLRCWVAPGRDSSSSAGSVRRVPSLRSSVSLRLGYTWSLFLQTSAGVNPAGSLPGAQDAAVPAAGAACVRTSPPHPAPERPTEAFGRERRAAVERCLEPSRLRPGRPSATPRCRSPPLRRRAAQRPAVASAPEPAIPTTPDRLPGQPPLRSGSLVTGRLAAAAHKPPHPSAGCETASNQGHPKDARFRVRCSASVVPRPDDEKGV